MIFTAYVIVVVALLWSILEPFKLKLDNPGWIVRVLLTILIFVEIIMMFIVAFHLAAVFVSLPR